MRKDIPRNISFQTISQMIGDDINISREATTSLLEYVYPLVFKMVQLFLCSLEEDVRNEHILGICLYLINEMKRVDSNDDLREVIPLLIYTKMNDLMRSTILTNIN